MDFPTVLLRDLLQLSSSVDLDEAALAGPLVSLVDDLRATVPSYRGLHLTIIDISHPVSLNAFLPDQDVDAINTSLRVGFAALGPGFDGESRVVFYAATPGAFVDLAADFAYALDTPVVTTGIPPESADSTDDEGQHSHSHSQRDDDRQHGPRCDHGDRLIVLDADLPPTTTQSGLIGLEERSTIDRAVGVMIDHGHHPDRAHATLRRQAAAAGAEPHLYAGRLLRG